MGLYRMLYVPSPVVYSYQPTLVDEIISFLEKIKVIQYLSCPDSLWEGQFLSGSTWSLCDPCHMYGVKSALLLWHLKQNTCRLGMGEASAWGGVSMLILIQKECSILDGETQSEQHFPLGSAIPSEGGELRLCP